MDIDGPLQSKLGLQSRAKLGAFIESDGFFMSGAEGPRSVFVILQWQFWRAAQRLWAKSGKSKLL